MKLNFKPNPKNNGSTCSTVGSIVVIWNEGSVGEHEVMFTGYSKATRQDGLPKTLFVEAIPENSNKTKLGGYTSPIGRMGLHARKLSFIHPMTLEEIHFETPVPRNFLHLFHV